MKERNPEHPENIPDDGPQKMSHNTQPKIQAPTETRTRTIAMAAG